MIAVITSFSARQPWWEWWIEGFEALEFDRGKLGVFWLDNSGDTEFGQFLASYVAEHRQDYRRFELRTGSRSGTTENERAAACYNQLREAVLESGESITCLLAYEDDIVPPPDGLHRLHSFLAAHPTAAMAGAGVPCHDERTGRAAILAWRFGHDSNEEGLTPTIYQIPEVYPGVEDVDAVGLGFTLLRGLVFVRSALCPSALGLSFEQLLGWEVRRLGGRVFCLGEVPCCRHQLAGERLVSSFPQRRVSPQPSRPPETPPGFERHIALLTPFSGKAEILESFLQSLDSLDWESDKLHLVWLDNSRNPAFGARLEAALEDRRQRYASACLVREDGVIGPKYAQVAFLYRKLRRAIPAGVPYVFCWEDDILIPSRALRVLEAELEREKGISAVAGAVPYYRPGPPESVEVLLWRYESLVPTSDASSDGLLRIHVSQAPYHYFGTSEIDGCGFGCMLTRRHLFDEASLLAERFGINHDQIYGWELRRDSHRLLGVWHLACEHVQPDQGGRFRPVPMPAPQVDGLWRAERPVLACVTRQEYPNLLVAEEPGESKYLFLIDEHSHPGEDYLAALVEALEADDNLSHAFGIVRQGDRVVPVEDANSPWQSPACSVFRRTALEEIPNWEQLLGSQVETLTGELLRNGWRCKQVAEVCLQQDPAPITPRPKPAQYLAEYQRRQGRPLSVLFQNRPRSWSGGDMIHMEGLQEALRQDGLTADFRPPGFRSIQDWDLVHLMHIAFPWSVEIAQRCIEQEHPFVVSSILQTVDSLPDLQTVGLHASAIIAASEGERRKLLSCCPDLRDKIVVIPLGLDPSWFVAPEAPLDLGERYVLCAGRYERQKRQRAVLEACRQIGARVVFVGGPDCTGSWEYYDELIAQDYGKATVLRSMPRAELQRLFYGAHVVCQASEYESFGLTGIEAAAAGANLVMSNRTLATDQFAWASFCDPFSVDSIAASLGEQLEAPREPKPRPLSWQEVARRTIRTYLRALA